MVIVENIRIRANTDGSTGDLIGWAEFVLNIDNIYKVYINNVKVKFREDKSSWRLEYPSKAVDGKDGVERKVFYVKPINKETYELVDIALQKWLKEQK